jgi:hypothetical protein
MWALLSRIFGSIIIGLFLTSFTILLMTLFLSFRNLPKILTNFRQILRSLLRGSYRIYNSILSPLRIWVFPRTGIDIFSPLVRALCTTTLSLLIGLGSLTIFSQPILTWEVIILALHGLFIGLAWDGIMRSDDFQMGVNLE